jgi:hypothetical protein
MPWASAAVVAPRRIAMVVMSPFKVTSLLRGLRIDMLSIPIDFGHKVIAAQAGLTGR